MAVCGWDDIDVNFGDGEETVNFGPRAESGTALYQVETTATISHRGEVSKLPLVCGVGTDDVAGITAGAHLSLFGDGCRRFLATHGFEAEIDTVAVTENGHFLVVGDASGSVHFFDCHSQIRLFSKMLVSIKDSEANDHKIFEHLCFTSVTDQGVCDLIVTTRDQVFILENLQVASLKEALAQKDLERAKALQRDIQLVTVNCSAEHDAGAHYAVTGCRPGTLVTAGGGESCLCVWEKIDKDYVPVKSMASFVFGGTAIEKCVPTKCGNLIFTLDAQGVLRLVSVQLLVVVRQWRHAVVKDFILQETGDANNFADVKLVLLKCSPDGSTVLDVCTLPAMEAVYSLVLSASTALVHTQPNVEAIFVVEGVAPSAGDSKSAATLRIRSLTESLPETRLYRLLHKHQYQEAENFAKLFNQDIELVYKAKAGHLFEVLSPWKIQLLQVDEISDNIRQLLECLELIKDDVYVAKSCTKAALPTFQATFDLLMFVKNRLNRKTSTSGPPVDDNDTSVLLTRTLEMLYRLGTYQVAFGIEVFSGESWDEFLRANMLQEVMSQLQEGNIRTAVTVWNRHQGEFVKNFNVDVLSDLLSSVPEQTAAKELKPWLTADLIPYVIRKCADGLPIVASWIEQRARNMEIYDKAEWPANSLEFSELLQNTCVSVSHYKSESGLATPGELSTQISSLPVGYYQMKNKQDKESPSDSLTDAFHSLNTLIYQLRELMSLHNKYKCRLSLAEYVRETTESLTYRMLDRVSAVELIPSAITKFVRPYMAEHRLNQEKILFQYIGDLAKRSGGTRVARVGQTHWESKAIAVISCIQDPDYKLQAIHDAMKRAYVPWSKDMETLVQEGLALDHPRVCELRELYMLTELHQMLIQYGLRSYNFRDSTNAETLVYYILSQDRSTAVPDALRAVQAYSEKVTDVQVYSFRIRFLVQHARLDEALSLLRSLPAPEARVCGRQIVTGAIVDLNDDIVFNDEHKLTVMKDKLLSTHAACEILKILLNKSSTPNTAHTSVHRDYDVFEHRELQRLLESMTAILALQMEFGEFVSYDDFQKENFRKNLLLKYLAKFYGSTDGDKEINLKVQIPSERKYASKFTLTYAKICRLGEILRCSHQTLRLKIALAAIQKGELDIALDRAKELYSDLPSPTVARGLFQIAQGVCQYLANQSAAHKRPWEAYPGLHEAVQEMARLALVHCGPELLSDCLELCKCLTQANDVLRNCESGVYGTTVQGVSDEGLELSSKDPYKEWTFSTFFSEEGLVMDSCVATPLVYRHCAATLPAADVKSAPYVQNRVQGTACSGEGDQDSVLGPLNAAARDLGQYLCQNGHTEIALGYSLDTLASNQQYLTVQSMGNSTNKLSSRLSREREVLQPVLAGCRATRADLTTSVLNKLLTKGRVDHPIALGYFCDLTRKQAFEMLKRMAKNAGHQYKKALVIALLSMDLSELLGEVKAKVVWEEYKVNAEWGLRLTKLKIPFKDIFKLGKLEKRTMLPDLISSKNVTIDIIKSFCSSFNLVAEDAILLYLERLLLPAVTSSDNVSSGDANDMATARMTLATLDQVDRAMRELPDKKLVVKTLMEVFSKIDFYDYERIGFVLDCLLKKEPSPEIEKGKKLFARLKVYKRVTVPSEYEINYKPITEEEEVMYGSRQLSPLAKDRLPFQPLLQGDPWKIITPELNATTVNTLWPIARLLELDSDSVYLATIRNLVAAHVEKKKSSSGASAKKPASSSSSGTDISGNVDKSKCSWSLDRDAEETFFPTVKRLLLQLSSCENAVMCCNYIMKELPIGAEKVAALQACVDFTKKWAGTCEESQAEEKKKALAMHERFFTWYKRLSIEQVLFQNNIGKAELLAMSNNPVKLIFKLYEHDSVLTRYSPGVVLDSLPDIHKITDGIAQIADVAIGQIRLSLLEKWLPSSRQDDADMTFNMSTLNLDSTLVNEDEGVTQDEINLQRSIYLIQNEKNGTLFLMNYIFEQESRNITNKCRVRALRCLFSLMDIKAVNKIHNQPVKLDTLLMKLVYMVQLDKLHLPQTLEVFSNCNKEGLVRGIWLNHSHDRQAVRLVADLCLDFHIHDVQLWNSVLQQLMAFQTTDYLRHILVRLSYDPELWKAAAYNRTWSRVIMMPLAAVSTPLTDEQIAECLDSYSLIYRCPLILDLDLVAFSKQFARLDLVTCALGCLLLLAQDDQRASQVSALLEGQVRVIIDQLRAWEDRGRIVPMMEQVRHAVYARINSAGDFPILRGTGLEHDFSMYLARLDDIDGLLRHSVTSNRMSEAIQLLSLYERILVDSEYSRSVRQEVDDLQKLKTYLVLHDMNDLLDYLPEQDDDAEDNDDGIVYSD